MNTQIDWTKVRLATQRYGKMPPARQHDHPEHPKDPIDAAIRKPLLKRADKCSGFYCKHFLHGH